MNEKNSLDSSQESLPLSQETFSSLMNVLSNSNLVLPPTNDWGNTSSSNNGNSPVQFLGEFYSKIPQQVNPVPCVSLPAVSNWSGDYSFNVFIESQEPVNKKVTWLYSGASNKLYVRRDAPCAINFSTSVPMGEGVFIRAMAVYSEPKHTSEVVTRCLNDSMKEMEKDIFEAQHLIRCESALSLYEVDINSQRHSVCVPYENPPVGQDFSTYLYKFSCFNSCSGGPNRRPITLVFTLEQGNCVIGRHSFNLKVCACPARDMKNDEKPKVDVMEMHMPVLHEPHSVSPAPKKAKLFPSNSQEVFPAKKVEAKAINVKPQQERKDLIVRAEDENMYKFLFQMKKYYKMQQNAKTMMSKSFKHSFFYLFRSSSDED